MIENALMWMVSAIGQIVYETCKILAQIVARVFITAFDMLFAGFALVCILGTPWTWPSYCRHRDLSVLFETTGDEWWNVCVMDWENCGKLWYYTLADWVTLPCLLLAALNPHRYFSPLSPLPSPSSIPIITVYSHCHHHIFPSHLLSPIHSWPTLYHMLFNSPRNLSPKDILDMEDDDDSLYISTRVALLQHFAFLLW